MRRVGCAMAALAGVMALLLLAPGVSWAREPMGARQDHSDIANLYAIRPPNLFRENVGLINLMITNVGVFGNPGFTHDFACEWRGGEYLYAGALWIGAIASDNLPYVSTGAYDFELRPSLDPVDTVYPAYEGIEHGNRIGFSDNPDDDGDGKIDEDPLNGKDDDGDGLIDEDYAGISQQMLSCEYWDYTQEAINAYPQHRPLHLKVRQNTYGWSTEGSNEFVGFDFNVINEGTEVLKQVYLGFFVDSDVGQKDKPAYWTDDAGAFYSRDTLVVDPTNTFECDDKNGKHRVCAQQQVHMDICYMYDTPDAAESNPLGDDVPGYVGGMFLGHTTDPAGVSAPPRVQIHTAEFFSGSGAYPAGDPRNDFERYDLLSNGIKASRPFARPDDYRFFMSAGPFRELDPGDHLQFQSALVIGDGLKGMLQNAINAQKIYNGSWRDTGPPYPDPSGPEGRETCLFRLPGQGPFTWRDPCDSLTPQVRTIRDTQCIPDNFVDNDCNCCTPLYSTSEEAQKQLATTLVHWVGTVAPPPPGTNLTPQEDQSVKVTAPPGDRRVIVQWDNLSELTADPIAQKLLFGPPCSDRLSPDSCAYYASLPASERCDTSGRGGYKIWRVEGWHRPVGSVGPNPEDWQLIANLSFKPPDGKGKSSPSYLGKYVQRPPIGPDSTRLKSTGSKCRYEKKLWYYPVGRYQYVDSLGLKNGMLYFYAVTAYSAFDDSLGRHFELSGRPSAVEKDAVIPTWAATDAGSEDIIVVPNPYIRGGQPAGWDLVPSDADPTGTKIAFAHLPRGQCTVRIYTLAGDLVQTLTNDGRSGNGTAFWNLISRNGQDIVSGVYLYSVECKGCIDAGGQPRNCGSRKIGRFAIIR